MKKEAGVGPFLQKILEDRNNVKKVQPLSKRAVILALSAFVSRCMVPILDRPRLKAST